MAVRFDADGEDYTRALALGTQAALTVTCWLKISVNRATWSTPWSIDNGTGDNWLIQTGADGITLGTVFDATSQQNMGALTVGTWYFVALAMNGSNGFLYHKTAAATGLSTVTVDGGTASVNAATLRIGESPWGGEWWNGCIAAVKVWTAQLSAAEVANEAAQYQPRRVANLTAYYPLVRPETTDYSGNVRTLTGGTGATREDGPPIPWDTTRPRLILPSTVGGTDLNLADAATLAGSRAATTTGETATATLALSDSAANGMRAAATPDTLTFAVIHADRPAGVRAAIPAETITADEVLVDTVGNARAGTVVGETATTALVVHDPTTGHSRAGSVGEETVTAGTGFTDPAVGGVRASHAAESVTFGVVFADIAGAARAQTAGDTLTASLVLTDHADAARCAGPRDVLRIAGPVTRGSIEPTDRATAHLAPNARDTSAMAVTDRTTTTMGG